MDKFTNGVVYLILNPVTERYKIGMTKTTTSKRLKQLQTGNDSELMLLRTHKTRYPFRVENMLHLHFAPKKVLNEWYDLTLDDVSNFNKTCSEMEDRIKALSDNQFFMKHIC